MITAANDFFVSRLSGRIKYLGRINYKNFLFMPIKFGTIIEIKIFHLLARFEYELYFSA
ncbi:MAG: hypothetical protein HYS25_04275 [Ignavibacteriales bacterium]|nr:hypothetical protein [Ignavibacteriales bacterium]